MAKDPQRSDRLAEVHQTELTESRVNEGFVDFLKTWGTYILYGVLGVALAGLGWNYLQQSKAAARDAAWASLSEAQIPASLEEVADAAADWDSVSDMALLRAGDIYLRAVITGTRAFDRDETAEDFRLDAATREDFLRRAAAIYQRGVDRAGDLTALPFARKPMVASFYFGLAATHEGLGDLDRARAALGEARALAMPEYPELAQAADARLNTLGDFDASMALPRAADLPQPTPVTPTFDLPEDPEDGESVDTGILDPAALIQGGGGSDDAEDDGEIDPASLLQGGGDGAGGGGDGSSGDGGGR